MYGRKSVGSKATSVNGKVVLTRMPNSSLLAASKIKSKSMVEIFPPKASTISSETYSVETQTLNRARSCSKIAVNRSKSLIKPIAIRRAGIRRKIEKPNTFGRRSKGETLKPVGNRSKSQTPNPIRAVKLIMKLYVQKNGGEFKSVENTLEPPVDRKLPVVAAAGVRMNKTAQLRIEANRMKLNGCGKPKLNSILFK